MNLPSEQELDAYVLDLRLGGASNGIGPVTSGKAADAISALRARIGQLESGDPGVGILREMDIINRQVALITQLQTAIAAANARAEALQEALKWYQSEAEAIARHMMVKPPKPEAILASVTILSLDAGRRAARALQEEGHHG